MANRTGSQIVLDALTGIGADTVFGYPGGAIMPLYDELLNYPQIKHVLTRHEQAAIHAADGFARASGRWGSPLPRPVRVRPIYAPALSPR
jgi:acetolactate synthase-1/2/3 large subunit